MFAILKPRLHLRIVISVSLLMLKNLRAIANILS